jgi:probable ATP-dependent RNA helicase DDX4
MFSATFPEDIQHLAGKFLHNYLFLAVGIVGGACTDVEQHFHLMSKFEKRRKLLDLLSQEGWLYRLDFVFIIKILHKLYNCVIFVQVVRRHWYLLK